MFLLVEKSCFCFILGSSNSKSFISPLISRINTYKQDIVTISMILLYCRSKEQCDMTLMRNYGGEVPIRGTLTHQPF